MKLDHGKVKILHDQHTESLIHFAVPILKCRPTAEDVVYGVFANMLHLCPEVENDEHAVKYIYDAVRNKCYDSKSHSQVVKNHKHNSQERTPRSEDWIEIDEAEKLRLQQLQRVHQEIEELPPMMKAILKAKLVDKLSNKQIAALYNITSKRVANGTLEAIKRIREKVGANRLKWHKVKTILLDLTVLVNFLKVLWMIYQYIHFKKF